MHQSSKLDMCAFAYERQGWRAAGPNSHFKAAVGPSLGPLGPFWLRPSLGPSWPRLGHLDDILALSCPILELLLAHLGPLLALLGQLLARLGTEN